MDANTDAIREALSIASWRSVSLREQTVIEAAEAALAALVRERDTRGLPLRSMLSEFHAAVAHPDTDLLWLRRTLHDEEHAELVEALEEEDRDHIARELADVVYVAFGTAHAYAINLDEALREVHRANMQKAHGPRREDGKAMKPPGFVPPDMSAALAAGSGEDAAG